MRCCETGINFPRGKYGRIACDLKQDFGLDRDTFRHQNALCCRARMRPVHY